MRAELPDRYTAETRIATGDDAAALQARVGAGPEDFFHGVPGLGYAGTHAIAVTGTADSGATEHRITLHAVDVAVTEDTELSYVLGYRLDDDRRYAGGHLALDVLLDDGTRISGLGAVDQLGFALTAAGQGASKALYPQQWNLRRARLGALADGRRAVAVELVWDATPGIDIAAWVDRIRLGDVEEPRDPRPVERVMTTRGTQSNGTFSRGNTVPATAWPNGFAFFTPVTDARTLRWIYSWSDHNGPDNRPRLQALAVSHQPSPWMGDRLAFQVMPQPTDLEPTADPQARSLGFDHDDEIARPHRYAVTLDGGVTAELAPTDHTVAARFGFPTGSGRVVFDNATTDGHVTVHDDGTVTGWSESIPGPRADGAGRMFLAGRIEADRPATVTACGPLTDGAGPYTAAHLTLTADDDSPATLTLTLRLATSLISVDQAWHTLTLEQGDADHPVPVDELIIRAADAWDERLSVLSIDGPLATEEARTTVASHLYRLNLYPNSGHENTGTAEDPEWVHAVPGLDPERPHSATRTGSVVRPGEIMVNNGFWDTYRTAWPAYALLHPALTADLVDGFVQHYRDAGWIPRWSSPGFADCMVGTSSDVAFADTLVKGVRTDAETAYLSAVRNAATVSPDTRMGRKSLDRAIFLGWTPTSEPEGLSWSIDNYINDHGIAAMAGWLLDHHRLPEGYDRQRLLDEHRWFAARALDYVKLFDPERGMFHGRDAAGGWRVPAADFDPDAWGDDYTEANAWTMAASVPHDGAGLAGLHGGRAGLADLLQRIADRPETGTVKGSYSSVIHEMTEARDVRLGMVAHSNQPAHHLPFMWLHAGRPDRTQEQVRELMSRFHAGSEIGQGYGGDEDNGEMSAWQLFAALGLHPTAVGTDVYSVGSPLYDRVTLRRDDGSTLEITAVGNSADAVYVAGLTVDDEPVGRAWLTHRELTAARRIEFTMAEQPQSWGADRPPPSLTPTGADGEAVAPRPLADVLTGARIVVDGEVDATMLVDDTSQSSQDLPDGAQLSITLAEPAAVELITVTSAAEQAPPTHWRLEAETADGWQVVCERNDQRFAWPRQTRPYAVGEEGIGVTARRWRWTALTSGRVAQLELLARS